MMAVGMGEMGWVALRKKRKQAALPRVLRYVSQLFVLAEVSTLLTTVACVGHAATKKPAYAPLRTSTMLVFLLAFGGCGGNGSSADSSGTGTTATTWVPQLGEEERCSQMLQNGDPAGGTCKCSLPMDQNIGTWTLDPHFSSVDSRIRCGPSDWSDTMESVAPQNGWGNVGFVQRMVARSGANFWGVNSGLHDGLPPSTAKVWCIRYYIMLGPNYQATTEFGERNKRIQWLWGNNDRVSQVEVNNDSTGDWIISHQDSEFSGGPPYNEDHETAIATPAGPSRSTGNLNINDCKPGSGPCGIESCVINNPAYSGSQVLPFYKLKTRIWSVGKKTTEDVALLVPASATQTTGDIDPSELTGIDLITPSTGGADQYHEIGYLMSAYWDNIVDDAFIGCSKEVEPNCTEW